MVEESTFEELNDKNAGEQVIKPFSAVKSRVEDIIDGFVNKKFREMSYDGKLMQKWANQASEEIIKRVQDELSQDHKFMCMLILLQKGDAGFHMSASCFWEQKADGNFNKKYDF